MNEKTIQPVAYKEFLNRAKSFVASENIYTDEIRRLAWGTDAGFYRLIPQIVIRSDSENQVAQIMALASELNLPVTFRAAGTSLSGQSVSDSILVVAGKNWEQYSVSPDASQITLQPGIVGAKVNKLLAPLGRKFGPDPASIGSCMVGGIVMNNASGMSCGTHANSDREILSARMVLADGTVLDTGSKESREQFAKTHKPLIDGIAALRDEVMADKELAERIRYKYSIKNVTGLNLLPFVRFTDPFDIITHLLVGSEGTLAFLSQVTMKTLPVAPYKADAMIYFKTIDEAARGVLAIKQQPITAAELLDKRSLASVNDPHWQAAHEADPDTDITSVLVQTEAADEQTLQANIAAITAALESFGVDVEFTTDAAVSANYWAIRSGIFPTVGGMRKIGTTCLIEDVAFHIEDLPAATADLSALLDRFGYDDSCIYGHALEGNFHFIINQSFSSDAEVERYERMIEAIAKLVVEKYDGSLKAEHGTGRNMAPFVAYEWGSKAFGVMKRVKALFDPQNIMNPGVIFNDDPKCYIKNFKALPVLKPLSDESEEFAPAYQKINKCIECGFCEVNCVSCGFTLSSRTRIVVQRELAHLRATGQDPERLKKLEKQYYYQGNMTCAGDGLCSTSCPMGINVGDLTHDIRTAALPKGSLGYKVGDWVANNFSTVKGGVRGLVSLASVGRMLLGGNLTNATGRMLHSTMGIPLWNTETPRGYSLPKRLEREQKKHELKVVYLPSCINQTMGLPVGAEEKRPLAEEMVALLQKAGYEVIFPKEKDSLCCGTIWESKGMPDVANRKVKEMEDALWKASGSGRYPVLCDQSPCLHRMRTKIKKMRLYEPAEFISRFLVDRLDFHQTADPVAVHVTCSTRLMKLDQTLIELAGRCSSHVIVPEGVGCCGFAGDKGMTHPELNAYALRKLKDQVKDATKGYSNSRTCEIGLSTASGIPYVSIAYLVNQHTTAKVPTE